MPFGAIPLITDYFILQSLVLLTAKIQSKNFKKEKEIQPFFKIAHFLTVLSLRAETNNRIHFIHRGMLDIEKNQRTNPNYSFISFSVGKIVTLRVQNWQN
jgi:hypothetical protein